MCENFVWHSVIVIVDMEPDHHDSDADEDVTVSTDAIAAEPSATSAAAKTPVHDNDTSSEVRHQQMSPFNRE